MEIYIVYDDSTDEIALVVDCKVDAMNYIDAQAKSNQKVMYCECQYLLLIKEDGG